MDDRKKRGRKPTSPSGEALTPAQRKRMQRERIKTAVCGSEEEGGLPDDQWTTTICLAVLNSDDWRGTEIEKAAWRQLGKLRGFYE